MTLKETIINDIENNPIMLFMKGTLEIYFRKDKEYTIPKSGLNFLKNESTKNNKFLLICGLENFDKFYVRVDNLEKLFLVPSAHI